MQSNQKTEISLSFEPGPASWFRNIREYLQDLVRRSPKAEMVIASEMDLSPSDLSRKLAQNDGDCRRLTTADVERYMESQLDYRPIFYWIEKYLVPNNDAEIQRRIQELQSMLSKKS